jgi:glucose/arabinose dehydrogenase
MMTKFIVAGEFFMRISAIAICTAAALAATQLHTALPAGFTDTNLFAVGGPTSIAFTPDGRMLITTQGGTLRVYQSGALLATPAITFGSGGAPAICSNSERGLLSVAVDPNFTANNYIYFYYTFNKFASCAANVATSPVNRVARFTLPGTNVISPATQLVLIDNIPSPNGNHNGGDLHFGKDGYLYVSVGDGGCQLTVPSNCQNANTNARRQDILSGKILRIFADGSIPATNPWVGLSGARRCGDPAGVPPGAGPCVETWEWGHRNPFRTAMDPNAATTRYFVNDVGGSNWEEIDANQGGADFGWNVREGHCVTGSYVTCSPGSPPPAGMTDPVYDYPHTLVKNGINCTSITGGAFIPNGAWPAAYDGTYLFSDYVCGNIFLLTAGAPYSASDFATALGGSSAVDLAFGPFGTTQSLYYTTYAAGGQVHRVDYTGSANRAPTGVIGATPPYGNLPLNVLFSAAGSADADGNPITCDWNFGDGNTLLAQPCTTASHNYTLAGTYTATLTVHDNQGGTSQPVTVRIDAGNNPPAPLITVPGVSYNFRVGEVISLQGSASDPEDGVLPAASLSWVVLLHHISASAPGNAHTHPFLPPTSGTNIPLTCPAPEDLDASPLSYLELQLSATDSKGLTRTISQTLNPNRVNATFATQPAAGFNLTINALSYPPQTFVSWENYVLNVTAPNQAVGGLNYVFTRWSDSGAQTHVILTPASATTYRAGFVCTPPANPTNLRIGKGAGAILNLTWTAGSGACQSANYRVYAAPSPAPATAPGFFPLDPAFTSVGTPATNSYSYTPAAGTLYYLVVSQDANGNNGSSGSYGDP